jgi:hypothetical protein
MSRKRIRDQEWWNVAFDKHRPAFGIQGWPGDFESREKRHIFVIGWISEIYLEDLTFLCRITYRRMSSLCIRRTHPKRIQPTVKLLKSSLVT